MRGNDFLDKMELIDPAYVEAADVKPSKRKNVWIKWGAMAACMCLVVVGILTIERQSAPNPPDFTNLELIMIPKLSVSGMGFEGYMYYDISELNNGNPWSENMNITFLPVYKNGAYDSSGAGVPTGLSEAEMMERLSFAASALDLEVLSTEVIADEFTEKDDKMIPDTNPTEIHAETNNGTIYIQADGGIVYFLPDEGLTLPDEYHFTQSSTTDAEAKNVLSYLIDVYRNLLAFEKPETISSGEYNIYGEFLRNYRVFDASGNDVEDILNYNFRCVRFSLNDRGNLYAIAKGDGLILAEKLGDYPVITAEEATERLTAGNYQTSVPVEFPGEEYIGKIELVYRTGRLEEIFLPYYRFYVLLPDAMNTGTNNGLKTYGAYYVPAISDEYIANMPTYDGRFN